MTYGKIMSQLDVSQGLDAIRAEAEYGDDDRAHTLEDALYVDVLRAIADGAGDAKQLAKDALKARDIAFNRWCS